MFSQKYGQRIFIEAWERKTEYTVAYLPTLAAPIIAPIEMTPLAGKRFVDQEAKADNRYLRFMAPGRSKCDQLVDYTASFASYCEIDGYFRLDILENRDGDLFIIDLNFLPGLNDDPEQFSYFPIAMAKVRGLSFSEVVNQLVAYPIARMGRSLSEKVEVDVNAG
jgi:D-alanine-D-alanine ligase-like ATP-grasp enzyme